MTDKFTSQQKNRGSSRERCVRGKLNKISVSCLIYFRFCLPMSVVTHQTDLLGFGGLECSFITHLVIRELRMCNMHFVPFHRLFFKENYSQKDKKKF